MKHVTFLSWSECPHLSSEALAELEKSIPPHQRRARMEGVPFLGAGAIFPIPLDEILEDPFPIPKHWFRCYGMDVGWQKTAALWLAHNKEDDIVHAYSEHYVGQAEPLVHAYAIMGAGSDDRAKWIPGVIDPAANGRSQADGIRLYESYKALGLNLELASNALESGIYAVWQRLSTGRLKFFRTLKNLQWEYNIYRRGENGKVVKKNDHLCASLRYAVVSGLPRAQNEPVKIETYKYPRAVTETSWMAS